MLSSSSEISKPVQSAARNPGQPVMGASVESNGSGSGSGSPPHFRVTKTGSHCRSKSRTGASPSQRRSSFLSACMQKETVIMQSTGAVDRNGEPTYALWVAESQGFKWNQTVYDVFEDELDFD